MGIRIHKMLGYGFSDIKHKKYAITDDRFKKNALINMYEYPKEWCSKNYIKWLKSKKFKDFDNRLEIKEVEELEDFNLGECLIYQGEYGLPEVFLVIPPEYKKMWYRYDDIIDYYDASISKKCTNWYKKLIYGIYPYIVGHIDTRNGKEVKDGRTYIAAKGTKNLKHIEAWAKSCGFKSSIECDKYLRCEVPKSIQLLCQFCDLFKNRKTAWQLEPMIYTYWS